MLSSEIVSRDIKEFSYLDIQKLGFADRWNIIKQLLIFVKVESEVCEKQSVGPLSDEEYYRESIDAETGIGEVKDTPLFHAIKNNKGEKLAFKVIKSPKESELNDHYSRTYIDRDSAECLELYRFSNLRFAEVMSAHNLVNQIEDLISQFGGAFIMESSAFQKAFNQCLPKNYLYSRKFREVITFFGTICSENIFENFIKYLLADNTIENCHLAERLLKERNQSSKFRHLINKLKQLKFELSRKQFLRNFANPSPIVRRICKCEALESGLSDNELQTIMNRSFESYLKMTNWLFLKQSAQLFSDTNSRQTRIVLSRILEITHDMIQMSNKGNPYKSIILRAHLSLLLASFEKADNSQNSSSSCTTPPSSISVSANSQDLLDKGSEESTIRISFDRMKLPRRDSINLQQIGSINKVISALLEALKVCESIDVNLVVKILILLGCSVGQIHSALAGRFFNLAERCNKLEVLQVLRDLGFVTQHTVDIPLLCIDYQRDIKQKAKEILRLLNAGKLKKYAMNVLVKEDVQPVKSILALRALGFASSFELDEEVVHFLVQFIDHYDPLYRLEALKSLYCLISSSSKAQNNDPQIRKVLAATPHVIRDRLKLHKYSSQLRVASLKALVML